MIPVEMPEGAEVGDDGGLIWAIVNAISILVVLGLLALLRIRGRGVIAPEGSQMARAEGPEGGKWKKEGSKVER